MTRKLQTTTLSNQNISSALLVATLTAGQEYAALMARVFLDQVAGNGDYSVYLTHQIGGAGSAYKSAVTSVAAASGVTAITASTIQLPVNSGDVVKVYVTGLAGDTTTPDIITEFWDGTPLEASGVRDALGLASANLDTQIGLLSTAAALAAVKADMDQQFTAILPLSPLMLAEVYRGETSSDAWSTMLSLGGSIILAGKRTVSGANYIYRSADDGKTFETSGAISGATGSNAYGLDTDGAGVALCGTGDTGNACILRSADYGATWSTILSAASLATLAGGAVDGVMRCLYMGSSRWLFALRTSATVKMLESLDNGLTFHAWTPTGLSSSCRDLFLTNDGYLIAIAYVQANGFYVSTDNGSTFALKYSGLAFTGFCELSAGVWLSGMYETGAGPVTMKIKKTADHGVTWVNVHKFTVNSTVGYVRSIIEYGGLLLAFASGVETSFSRCAAGAMSYDDGDTWVEFGNPHYNYYGGLHGIYDAVIATDGSLLLATQPDSVILRGGLSRVENIKAKTDNLPADPADQSAVEAAIVAATSPLATAAALAAVAGYVDTEVAAIKAKTDALPSDPADESLLEAAIETLRIANAAVVGSTVADGVITIRNYAQAVIALTGLPDFTGYTEIVLVGKRRQSDADSAALFYLSSLTGLVYLNGAAATPGDGSLTVVSSTAITGTIKASAMANLVAMSDVFCGAKYKIGGDWVSLAEYKLHIESVTPKVVT